MSNHIVEDPRSTEAKYFAKEVFPSVDIYAIDVAAAAPTMDPPAAPVAAGGQTAVSGTSIVMDLEGGRRLRRVSAA